MEEDLQEEFDVEIENENIEDEVIDEEIED